MDSEMKIIIEYAHNWILSMSEGRKFSGHDFFSGFPQPHKDKIDTPCLNSLYYALDLISEYDLKIELSYYEFLKDHSLNTLPWRMGKRKLTCNLLNSLKCIEYNLNNKI